MTDRAPVPATPFLSSRDRTRDRGIFWRLLGLVGSVYAAATGIAILAFVTFAAAYYEAAYGAHAAQVLVYHAWWFNAVFFLLTLCVIAAVVVRWPLKRHQWGFAVVHLGLVLLIIGFTVAGRDRLDGMLEAAPGAEASRIALPVDEVAAVGPGSQQVVAGRFRFPEVADLPTLARFVLSPVWPLPPSGIRVMPTPQELTRLPEGPVVRLVATLECGELEAGWVPGSGGQPAVRLRLNARTPQSPAPVAMADRWITEGADAMLSLGPAVVTFARARETGLVTDFLSEEVDATAHGTLVTHLDGQRRAFPIDPAQLPQELPLTGDMAITVVRVITNPRLVDGRLEQDDAAESSPLLQLALRRGSEVRTVFVSAYYLFPPLGEGFPELLYRHGELTSPAGGQGAYLQLLLGPDGALHVRSYTRSRGAVARGTTTAGTWTGTIAGGAGGPMELTADLTVLAQAVRGPIPVAMVPGKKDRATRWVQVEVAHDTASTRVWMPRGSRQPVDLPGFGEVLLAYRQATFDLKQERGFAIRLDRFHEGKDPGGMMSASYASDVTVLPASGEPYSAHVSMNEPLQVGSVALYQTQFMPEVDEQGAPTGRHISVFTAAEDPGRFLKYLGGTVLVAGMLLLYLWRPRSRQS